MICNTTCTVEFQLQREVEKEQGEDVIVEKGKEKDIWIQILRRWYRTKQVGGLLSVVYFPHNQSRNCKIYIGKLTNV